MKRYTQLPSRTRQLIQSGLAVFAILLGTWLVIQSPLFQKAAPSGMQLTDLNSVEQFQTQFNADQGRPRLILIASPT